MTFYSHLIFGQNETMFHKKQYQFKVGLGLMPVQRTNSQVDFKYIDGNQNSSYLVDTISANYNLTNRYFGNVLNIGVGYFITNNICTSINFKAHLNSFLSNKGKNGQVYGGQFDLGVDYLANISNDISISLGITTSRILGGYAITSGGAKNKEYLVVNGNELYGNDEIGFHIIDNSWGFSPKISINYKLTNYFILTANSGYQVTFGRTSRLNFAGPQQDGEVIWNRKKYNDADVSLNIDNTKINNDNINKLPYNFSGVFFELGIIINLNE